MLYINNWSIKMLKQKFPNYKVTSYCHKNAQAKIP